MRTITPKNMTALMDIQSKFGIMDDKVTVALAKTIADTLPLSYKQEANFDKFYRTTYSIQVKKVISDLHDIAVVNHTFMERLVNNFYRLRNQYCHPIGIPEDFWGANTYLDKNVIDLIKSKANDISYIGNKLRPLVIELFNPV